MSTFFSFCIMYYCSFFCHLYCIREIFLHFFCICLLLGIGQVELFSLSAIAAILVNSSFYSIRLQHWHLLATWRTAHPLPLLYFPSSAKGMSLQCSNMANSYLCSMEKCAKSHAFLQQVIFWQVCHLFLLNAPANARALNRTAMHGILLKCCSAIWFKNPRVYFVRLLREGQPIEMNMLH